MQYTNLKLIYYEIIINQPLDFNHRSAKHLDEDKIMQLNREKKTNSFTHNRQIKTNRHRCVYKVYKNYNR